MSDVRVGAPAGAARAAIVLVHGRGGSPEDMLGLGQHLEDHLVSQGLDTSGLAWVGLRAPGNSWYPFGFMEPLERNQPSLDESLDAVNEAVEALIAEGVPSERLGLIGFSQGACLSLEHAARTPKRLGMIAALSGGLIGPPGTPRDYSGSLEGTPAFLGCSDRDPHIPESRVRESAEALEAMEASVGLRIYPGMGHTVNQDEVDAVVAMIAAMIESPGRALS